SGLGRAIPSGLAAGSGNLLPAVPAGGGITQPPGTRTGRYRDAGTGCVLERPYARLCREGLHSRYAPAGSCSGVHKVNGRNSQGGRVRGLSVLAVLAGWLMAVGCGGGSSSGRGGNPPPPTVNNVAPISVNSGILNDYANGVFVSVMVCVPVTSNCQTIDNILLDTGSSKMLSIVWQLLVT